MYETEEYRVCEKCGHTPNLLEKKPPNKLEFLPGEMFDENSSREDLMGFTCPRCRHQWWTDMEGKKW